MNNFNFVPSTINGKQFLAYKQPGSYMTDYRSSSDMYSYLIKNASDQGVMTGHQLRNYLQDNAESFITNFSTTTTNQFLNMQVPGAPNTCSYSGENIIYSGGKELVDSNGLIQKFEKDCPLPGQNCVTNWINTPLPQQGSHCE